MSKKIVLIRGVGLNDADYPVIQRKLENGKIARVWCPMYQKWVNMLRRCYSSDFHSVQHTYSGCSVSPAWHKFSVFREWMMSQPWQGMEIDKDILEPGNKIYGPDKCVFISPALNQFLTDGGASSRGALPVGVCWREKGRKFEARCSNPFTKKNDHLGYFLCPSAAHEAWRKRKHQHALRYADMQDDPRVAEALRIRFSR